MSVLFGSRKKRQTYFKRVKILMGSALVAYWPLSETSGTTTLESVAARNGTYSGVTLNNALSPMGKGAPRFGPAAGVSNIYTAGLASVFNSAEGAFGCFVKMAGGVWSDATLRNQFNLFTDANNKILVQRTAANFYLKYFYDAGATVSQFSHYMANDEWFHLLISWSKSNNRLKCFMNGVLVQTVGGLGTWVGGMTASNNTLGGQNSSTALHSGWLSDAMLFNREATNAEAKVIGKASIMPKSVSIIGDSITTPDSSVVKWTHNIMNQYNSGWVTVNNHALGGHSILSNMAAQAAACATDDADLIILQLGTNDNNAGDQNALRSIIEAAIDTLRASNPRATIVYHNLLPRWTDSGGSTSSDKPAIRATIAQACVNKGIACWDAFTDPWIVAGDTLDGIHPTVSGHQKVAAQILARLV